MDTFHFRTPERLVRHALAVLLSVAGPWACAAEQPRAPTQFDDDELDEELDEELEAPASFEHSRVDEAPPDLPTEAEELAQELAAETSMHAHASGSAGTKQATEPAPIMDEERPGRSLIAVVPMPIQSKPTTDCAPPTGHAGQEPLAVEGCE